MKMMDTRSESLSLRRRARVLAHRLAFPASAVMLGVEPANARDRLRRVLHVPRQFALLDLTEVAGDDVDGLNSDVLPVGAPGKREACRRGDRDLHSFPLDRQLADFLQSSISCFPSGVAPTSSAAREVSFTALAVAGRSVRERVWARHLEALIEGKVAPSNVVSLQRFAG